MSKTNQYEEVSNQVRAAIESGSDVHRQVKEIVVDALTKLQLDMDNIRNVSDAVGKGINEGLAGRDEHAREVFEHAATALDDALAMAAEASKLAIQEAAYKLRSQHDLNDAIKDLQGMEGLFIDTLEKIAKGSSQAVADIVNDFVAHAQKSGTAVGKQTFSGLNALKDLPGAGTDALVSSTMATASMLAKIGSGILLGIAESIQPSKPRR
ncbi:MAG: DUF6781 family protein [Methylobacter sp.]